MLGTKFKALIYFSNILVPICVVHTTHLPGKDVKRELSS